MGRLKRLVPSNLRRHYHHLLAMLAGYIYGRPSRKLVVIGVTGTDGKTTTASFIADVLRASGAKVGQSTSAVFQVGDRRWLNETRMTMPGRFALQRLLRDMVRADCRYAVIEASSEGLAQYRHASIDFDLAVVTNVTPEHLEAHGSFEEYRRAKGLLFSAIIRGGDKRLHGAAVPKVTVVNLDDPSAEYFLQFWAQRHYGTALKQHPEYGPELEGKLETLVAVDCRSERGGSSFVLAGLKFTVPLSGDYNIRNALQALAVGRALGMDWAAMAKGLAEARQIPGRGEMIVSEHGWSMVIDYALTPAALEQLYQTLQSNGTNRIIAVFGAAGGGRDTWKRPELGKITARYCQKIILTTDDPYDEDPAAIAAEILAGVPAEKKNQVEIVLNRTEAIQRAMKLAQPGDIIAVTGMGSETTMVVKGRKVEWSDAQAVRQLLEHDHA